MRVRAAEQRRGPAAIVAEQEHTEADATASGVGRVRHVDILNWANTHGGSTRQQLAKRMETPLLSRYPDESSRDRPGVPAQDSKATWTSTSW